MRLETVSGGGIGLIDSVTMSACAQSWAGTCSSSSAPTGWRRWPRSSHGRGCRMCSTIWATSTLTLALSPGRKLMMQLVADGAWLKLSGAYRLSKTPPYADSHRFRPLLIEAAPDRCVWGSDWPTSGSGGPCPRRRSLDVLADWAPDPLARGYPGDQLATTLPLHPLMTDEAGIRRAVMRRGISKGPHFHEADLPKSGRASDKLLVRADGVSGRARDRRPRRFPADHLELGDHRAVGTSRRRPGLHLRPGGARPGSCRLRGRLRHLPSGVGRFAIDEGLVAPVQPITRARIFNTNTQTLLIAEVPIADGRAQVTGDLAITGVPVTAPKSR